MKKISEMILFKPNQLIEVKGAPITTQGLLAYDFILHRLQQEKTDRLTISVGEITNAIGVGRNYDEIYLYLDSLQKIRVESKDIKGRIWGAFNLLSEYKKCEEGVFVSIPPTIFKALGIKEDDKKENLYYTAIKLLEKRIFQCVYSLIFYDLFAKYEKINIPIFTLDEIRAFTGTVDKYTEYKVFKVHVLNKAIKEINKFEKKYEYTFEEIKSNRKVKSIKFIRVDISKNDKEIIPDNMPKKVIATIKKVSRNIFVGKKISIKSIETMLKKYDEVDVIKALNNLFNYNKEITSFSSILKAEIEDVIKTKVAKNKLNVAIIEPIKIKKTLGEKDYQEYLENEKKMSDSLPLEKTENFQNISISKKEETLAKKYANQLISEVNTVSSQEEVEIIDIQELKNGASERFHEMNEEVIRRQIEEEVAKSFDKLQEDIANRIRDMRIAQTEKMVLRAMLSKYVSLNELEEFCKVLDRKYGKEEIK